VPRAISLRKGGGLVDAPGRRVVGAEGSLPFFRRLSALKGLPANIATGTREVPSPALIENLRMDPYERGMEEGGGATEFLAPNVWLQVPIQGKIKEFFADYDQFPVPPGIVSPRRPRRRRSASSALMTWSRVRSSVCSSAVRRLASSGKQYAFQDTEKRRSSHT
jgi:hypothetical protein